MESKYKTDSIFHLFTVLDLNHDGIYEKIVNRKRDEIGVY